MRSANETSNVALNDLRAYLRLHGWVSVSTKSDRWELFRRVRGKGEGIELILPVSEAKTDAKARISAALSVLAQLEGRQARDVCLEISGSDIDSIMFKLLVSDSGAESIPLDVASRNVKAMRDLLLYGACSELESQAHFEQPLPAARGIAQGFNFCHTFRGSFGFEVSSRVASKNLTLDLFQAPARRRIVERFTRGMLLLEKAVERKSPELIVSTFNEGLNARMCDSLIALAGDDSSPYEVDVRWGQVVQPASDVANFSPILVSEASIEVLAAASEALKRVDPHPETIRGLVVNLHCVRNPLDGGARRTIEVKSLHPQRGTLLVRMSLDPLFYSIAIDAHARGIEVEAAGSLQRTGNTWTLDPIASFVALGG